MPDNNRDHNPEAACRPGRESAIPKSKSVLGKEDNSPDQLNQTRRQWGLSVHPGQGYGLFQKPQEGKSILCPWKTKWKSLTDLPAGIIGESRDLHAMRCAAGSGSIVALTVVVAAAAAAAAAAGALVAVTSAAGELDSETLAHEVRSILGVSLARKAVIRKEDRVSRGGPQRTES